MSSPHEDASRLARLVESITHELAHSLKEAPENVDPDLSFAEMGADSLILLEALQEINARYRVALTVQEMYEGIDTIAKLARYIHESGGETRASAESVLAEEPGDGESAPAADDEVTSGDLAGSSSGRQRTIEEIVRHQLELMERQLTLLSRKTSAAESAPETAAVGAASARAAPARAAAPPSDPAPRASAGRTDRPADRFSAFGVELGSDERAEDAAKVAHIRRLASSLNAKMVRSRSEVQAYRRVLADNRVPAGFRPLLKEMVYPVLAEEARGAHVIDIDGNEYVDFTMGFGAHLFGHSPSFVVESLKRQLERGMPIGPQSPKAGRVAELICELTGHARVTFCNSGTEATMTAVRLARARTGRDKVVIFRNSYHGTFDGFLARTSASSASGGRPASLGTPESMVQDTIVLEYCAESALDHIRRFHHEIAAVLVEPVQSRAPGLQPGPFLRQLRRVTQEKGIALVFDEVITGFRCAPGGAQEYFDVRADLCTYGKVLGGGMPIGVIAGSADYMDRLDGGWWQFGDASYPAQPTIFFAGTFSKHPLAMAASLAVLEHIRAAGRGLYQSLNDRTQDLCRQLNAAFTMEGAEVEAECWSSLFRFSSKGSLDLFYHHLRDAGFFIWEGRNCFLCTEHTDEDLSRFVTAVQRICRELVAAKLLPARRAAAESARPAAVAVPEQGGQGPIADAQRRFHRLARETPAGNEACNLCYGLVFRSPVDGDRLAGAAAQVAERSEALWFRFDLDRAAQQRRPESDRHLEIARVRVAEPAAEPALDRLLEDEQQRALDPAAGQNLRAGIYSFQDGTTLLTVCVHHLVCDGWGLALLFERIAAAYDGAERSADATRAERAPAEAAAQPDLDVPYSRWLDHEAAYARSDRHARDRAFWHGVIERIAAYQRDRAFGAVRHRSAIGARSGGRARLSLGEAVPALLRAQAAADRATPFTSLLAAFQLFLNRVYRDRLPIIGIPFANRTSAGLKQIVGSCVNLLPLLPVHGGSVTFESSLSHAKQAMNELFQHARFPYHEICALHERLTGEEGTAPVEVTFNVEPVGELPRFAGERPALLAAANRQIEFDLMFNIFVLDSEIRIELDYHADLFAEDTAYGWLNLFSKIVENYAGQADPTRTVRPLPSAARLASISH